MRELDVNNLPAELREALGIGEKHEIKVADPLAQMMELQTRYKAIQDVADIQPGDLCLEKDAFASEMNRKVGGTIVYLYVGPIDWSNQMHQAYMAKWSEHDFEPTDDSWLGFMIPGKNVMCIRPYTKARLRKLTAAEMVGLDME